MLVLSRKKDEVIRIGDSIRITVLESRGNVVRLGIAAPDSETIVREELLAEGQTFHRNEIEIGEIRQRRALAKAR